MLKIFQMVPQVERTALSEAFLLFVGFPPPPPTVESGTFVGLCVLGFLFNFAQ